VRPSYRPDMTTATAAASALRSRARRRGVPLLNAHRAGIRGATQTTLRVGVERGMVAMVAVAGPLLVLQCLPAFLAERSMDSGLSWLSLLLAGMPCVLVPMALRRSGMPDRSWLLLSVLCFLMLVVFERFEIRVPMPTTFEPWLAGIACITVSYVAIGIERPLFAGAASAVVVGEMAAVYSGAVATEELVADVLGVLALSAGLIVGVRVLRGRAGRGDDSRRAAQKHFERSRRHFALEEERIRTDALLHDSVLTTFLVAAAGRDTPDRNVLMARRALEVVSAVRRVPGEHGATQSFERAVLAAEHHFAPIRGRVRLDLSAARAVELPLRAADALIGALVQALDNSLKHAGPLASCVARAEPMGDGGLRISVQDDGRGFDCSTIAGERLGVRVSIIERVRAVGGTAEVRSTPGCGTSVVLEWTPESDVSVIEAQRTALR
jgi:signal transduction histidine kinase